MTGRHVATTDRQLPARFVGVINRKGPKVALATVQRVVANVPAGETRTIEVEDDWAQRSTQDGGRNGTEAGSDGDDGDDGDAGGDDEGDDGRTVEYAIHWAGDSTRVTFGTG